MRTAPGAAGTAAGASSEREQGGQVRQETVVGIAGAVAALTLVLASGAAAQEARRRSETTARPRATAVEEVSLGAVQVITAAQIAAAGAPDITSALALASILVVDDTGGPAGVATVSLRGSSPQQVLVLLDGQRLTSAQSPFFDVNDVPVPIERVERIEVIPAPASAMHGADALGGVVNIVTRAIGAKPGLSLSLGLGGDAERRLAGGAQYGVGKLGLRFDGQLRSGDGFRDNGDFDLKNATAGLTVAPAPWGLDVRWSTLEREAGDPGPEWVPTPNARRNGSRDDVRAELSYRSGDKWDVRAGGFSRQQSLDRDDPDPPDADAAEPAEPVALRRDSSSKGLDARLNFETSAGELFTVGGEWVADEVDAGGDGSRETDRWGVFAQDQWRYRDWSAVGAIRRDEDSAYGEHTGLSLAGGWGRGGWKFSAGWARGRRVPGFDELYRDEESFQGNPDLKPETSESYEGSAELAGGGGRVRLSVFRRSVSDLIRWADADGDLVYRPENVASAKVEGWEAEVLYRPSATIEIPVGYQRLSAEDEETGESLEGVAQSLWRAGVRSTGSSFTWSVDYAVTDRGQFRLSDEDWSYGVLNAAVSWRRAFKSAVVLVSVRGENLRDEDYQAVEGYPQRGRAMFAEVRVEL